MCFWYLWAIFYVITLKTYHNEHLRESTNSFTMKHLNSWSPPTFLCQILKFLIILVLIIKLMLILSNYIIKVLKDDLYPNMALQVFQWCIHGCWNQIHQPCYWLSFLFLFSFLPLFPASGFLKGLSLCIINPKHDNLSLR